MQRPMGRIDDEPTALVVASLRETLYGAFQGRRGLMGAMSTAPSASWRSSRRS
jgi:hypothetical protein